jgi:hypothetical protein
LADFNDQSIQDGARTNALAGYALFKQFRETFCHVISCCSLARFLRAPRGYQKNGDRSLKAAIQKNLTP